jgi:pyruvate dehydrogenase E1 component alpha subunit
MIKEVLMAEKRHLFPSNPHDIAKHLGKEGLLEALKKMLLIRNFEIRAETAYQMGKIGGFFHAYIGQEAIQTAVTMACGQDQWWVTTYRCHALALLLGATPNEIMAELYGKATGNALGRGGSMHLFTDRLLGGHGIVGGQIPVGTGAAFAIKYRQKMKMEQGPKASFCFMGDGAVAQGSFHESLNLAALWDLPCIYVIENNQWGMGTHVKRALSVDLIAETKAPGYGIKGYSIDGMDFFSCYAAFKEIYEETVRTSKPALVEVFTERFRGHSISDPGLYRSKEKLSQCMERDPILILSKFMKAEKMLTDEQFEKFDEEAKQIVLESMKYADQSPWPDPHTLGEDVFAPVIKGEL